MTACGTLELPLLLDTVDADIVFGVGDAERVREVHLNRLAAF
jgi:hypothetical protein